MSDRIEPTYRDVWLAFHRRCLRIAEHTLESEGRRDERRQLEQEIQRHRWAIESLQSEEVQS